MWTDVSLYVSDTEEADEPTLAIELPTPMYGGKVDMVRGEIATTYNSKESGTGWEMTEEGQFRCQVSAYNNGDETSTDVADLYAVHYETVSNKDAYDATDDLTCGLATIAGTTYLYVNDAQYTTLESFATNIADEVFVFRAHIPMSDVTEPHIVYLPAGTSYVWADAGFVDLTVSGTPPLSLPNSLGKPLKAWEVALSPYQDLHGYDSPWPAGGGKNILNPNTVDSRNIYIESTSGAENVPTPTGGTWRTTDYIPVTEGQELYFGQIMSTATYAGSAYYDSEKEYVSGFSATSLKNASNVKTVPSGVAYLRHSFRIDEGYNTDWENSVYITLNSNPHQFSPYANICPIYGTDKLNVFVEESYDPTATPKVVITFDNTLYGGTYDAVSGVGTITSEFLIITNTYTRAITRNSINDENVYYDIKLPTDAIEVTNNDETIRVKCNRLKAVTAKYSTTSQGYPTRANCIALISSQRLLVSLPRSMGITTASDFIQWLASNPLEVTYELATPIPFTTDGHTIKLPKGTASTWATAEDGTVDGMEVTYVGKAT